MAKGEEPDATPPRSIADPSEFRAASARSRSPPIHSPAPKSRASATLIGPNGFGQNYPQRAGSKVDPGHDDAVADIAADDVDSNVQEGVRSEVGEMIPFVRLRSISPYIFSLTLQQREPGPQDPPGPKYESYDSGPSFGNFGPLPADDHPSASNNPYAQPSWNVRYPF